MVWKAVLYTSIYRKHKSRPGSLVVAKSVGARRAGALSRVVLGGGLRDPRVFLFL